MLRAWNLPDGLLIWESILKVSTLSKSLLYMPVRTDFLAQVSMGSFSICS